MSDDPVRLREDPNEPESLRAMIAAAKGEHVDDAMMARVLAGVIASGGGGGGTSGGAAATKGAFASWAGGVGLATLAILVATWSASTGRRDVALPEVDDVLQRVFDASADVDAGASDAGMDATSDDVDAGHVARAPRPVLRPAPIDPALDIPHAREAAAALEHDPARALSLADAHRRDYPDSVLAEDREATAILAMLTLDRDAAARLASFRARWPRSAHLRRIEAASMRDVPGRAP